jgi:ribosomal-protein-alanine N-acetyltransferase
MPAANLSIRPATSADLPAVAAIQEASPGAAQWNVADYLDHEFQVAIVGKSVAGFLVSRQLAPGEQEILNLAVAPEFRRQGVARALASATLARVPSAVFLEVRESNTAAQEFYKALKFKAISRRDHYYSDPPEAAIVMKFHSC